MPNRLARSGWSELSVQAGSSAPISSHEEALAYILANKSGNGGMPCPHCGGKRVKAVYKSAVSLHKARFVCEDKKCKGGGKRFGILSGTALAGLQIPMHFALFAALEFGKGSDGMSAPKAGDYLGISRETARTLYKRIGRLVEEGNGYILGDFAPASAVKANPSHPARGKTLAEIGRKPHTKKPYGSPPAGADFGDIPVYDSREQAFRALEHRRWPDGVKCPSCGGTDVHEYTNQHNGYTGYRCRTPRCDYTRNEFNVLTKTPMARTQLLPHYWMFASREFNKGEAGMTGDELAKALQITDNAANNLYQKIGRLHATGFGYLLGEYAPIRSQRIVSSSLEKSENAIFFPKPIVPCDIVASWTKRAGITSKRTTVSEDMMHEMFPDDDSVVAFFIEARWGTPDNVRCPDCDGDKIIADRASGVGHYRCRSKDCKRDRFNYKTHTNMMCSKIPPRSWLRFLHAMAVERNGSSARELLNKVRHVYRTCYFAMHRVRNMYDSAPDGSGIGPVELDEYHIYVRRKSEGRKKILERVEAVAAHCRTTGKFFTGVYKKGEGVSHAGFAAACVSAPSTFLTDGTPLYNPIQRQGHKVAHVNHGEEQYAREPEGGAKHESAETKHSNKRGQYGRNFVHNNSVENLWSGLKAMYSTYRAISPKHLQRYLNELAYRRGPCGKVEVDLGNRIAHLIRLGVGRRLTYRELVGT